MRNIEELHGDMNDGCTVVCASTHSDEAASGASASGVGAGGDGGGGDGGERGRAEVVYSALHARNVQFQVLSLVEAAADAVEGAPISPAMERAQSLLVVAARICAEAVATTEALVQVLELGANRGVAVVAVREAREAAPVLGGGARKGRRGGAVGRG